MTRIRLAFLAILLTIPASASILYAFTESWSNPSNTGDPQGSFGFSFDEHTFLSDTTSYFIPGSSFQTCDLSGMDPLNTCAGAWISFDRSGVNVQLLADYSCPDCDYNPYQLANVFFPGADLESFGDWTTPAGTGTAEWIVVDPPDAPATVPEPATASIFLAGLGALAAFWKIRGVPFAAPVRKQRP